MDSDTPASRFDTEQFLHEHENKSLLRLLTCGSVDDGKSTLIGRLLFDSKLLFEDQLSTLHRDSSREGNAGEGEVDYALLLDGLKDEREQGITIDVAYRYFATPRRKFIIADTPGHEQYTRNMATGASTADLAIVLIDARKGVITQTRRHSFIVSLLGIRHVVVAVNKMDLVDFSRERFDAIRQAYEELNATLALSDVRFVPVSALRGDNVVERSSRTPWYEGPPLLEILETVDPAAEQASAPLRFPVQFVNRPNLDFRGFAGTVVSGLVRKGDRVMALPSTRQSTVRRIVTADGDLEQAFAPQAVTLTLEDEIDVGVGEMLVHPQDPPHAGTHFDATLLWLSDVPLDRRTTYLLRQTTRNTNARVETLEYRIDVNSFEKQPAESLRLNEIGRVSVTTHQPLFFDAYRDDRETGSFILIDPVRNGTVAAGMIEGVRSEALATSLASRVDRREYLWDRGSVSPELRANRNHHHGKTVLLVGADDAARRDLARRLELTLFGRGFHAYYLGMSNLLEGLDADIGRNFRDRDEHIRRLGELARIMTDAGLIFIGSLDRADEVDLQRIKTLNLPNELFVVRLGGPASQEFAEDVVVAPGTPATDAVQAIVRELTRAQVILDYTI